MPYLMNDDHLLIFVVPADYMKDETMLTYAGMRATFSMTGKELLDACVSFWGLDQNQTYQLTTVINDQTIVIPPNETLKEAGIRQSAPIQMVSS